MRRAAILFLPVILALGFPRCSFAALPWPAADLPPGEIMSDPEALGLGAVKSLRGTGARAAVGNPAGLVDIPGNAMAIDVSEGPAAAWPQFIPGLVPSSEGGHGIPQAIAYGHSFGRYALGAGFMRTFRAAISSDNGSFTDKDGYRSEAYQLAGGWRANDWLSLGLGARLVSGTGTEVSNGGPNFNLDDTQTAFGGSAGARAKLHRLDLSLLAEGGTNFESHLTIGAFPETLLAHQPVSVRLGGEFHLHPLVRILGEAAYFNRSHYNTSASPDNFRSTVDGSAGVEVKPGSSSPVRLRAGLLRRTDPFNEGHALVDYGQTFLTLGIGLKAKDLDVDLAMASSDPFEDVSKGEVEQTHWAGGVAFSF